MRKEIRLIDRRIILVPIIFSIFIFMIIGKIIADSITQHYIEHVEELSLNLARGYSNSITKSLQAEEIINQLLEDKLLLASEAIGLYTNASTPQELKQVAASLRVDEINIYDVTGKLLLTTMDGVTELFIDESHPMFELLHNQQTSLVEEVRANAVTGILYKYGYFRIENGTIIQIGVFGDVIADVLNEVNILDPLIDMVKNTDITQASFVSLSNQVTHSSLLEHQNIQITDLNILDAIRNNDIYGFISTEDQQVYELFVPIFVNQSKIGTLFVSYTMKGQQEAMNFLISIGIIILLIFFGLITYVMVSDYDKKHKLSKAAFIDSLTGLPNASYLQSNFKFVISQSNPMRAIVLINVNEFKKINMAYGYDVGDQVIIQIANRLKTLETSAIQLFRFNSDRFIFLITQPQEAFALQHLARKVCHQFDDEFNLGGAFKHLSAEMGGVMIEDASMTLSKAIQKAVITIDFQEQKNHCAFTMFNQAIQKQIEREEGLLRELDEIIEGIDTERLSLVFQPQLDLTTQRIIGIEALARLKSKVYGQISPVEFIALAEKHHLIYDLGKVILKMAAKMSTLLEEKGLSKIRVAVNISGIQLLNDQFQSDLMDLLNEENMIASNLELEITESILIHDVDSINSLLSSLQKLGVLIALDDFGTGYSSFYRLSELNVDMLKIDRSFVQQISNLSVDKLITSEIIQMAHKYDLQVIAEGVENQIELDYLTSSGCDIIQGYFFSWPLPKEDLIEFLEQHNQSCE